MRSISADRLADQADIDSYRLIQTLTPDHVFLCSDASANVVVLVRLEDDCLHQGILHPSVRDRLARLRELPHPRVATLRGVERWNGIAYLVWIYLDGENWDDHVRQHPEQFPMLAASVAAAVDALHDLGIVHGNLHGQNIIVRPDGEPWLTQISPYLYTDPQADISAVMDLLRQTAGNQASARTTASKHVESVLEKETGQFRLHRLLDQFDGQQLSLKQLSEGLLESGTEEVTQPAKQPLRERPGYRRRSLQGALIITLIAMVIGACLRWAFYKSAAPGPITFPSLKPEGQY
jgi:hypothetical protein